MRARSFEIVAIAAVGLVASFLLLPVVAILARVSPGSLWDALGSDVARDALRVSAVTSAIAHLLVLLVGTPAAYLLATRRFRGRTFVISVVELPLVLPPAVAGIGLLAAFGRFGLVGRWFEAGGFTISFSRAAVVMAVVFVSSPFYVRHAIAAFESIDVRLLQTARTLGAGPWKVFFGVALPLARGGLGAGSAVAFARGLGEFGATIMFAGSFQGVTQTLPLAIYSELDRDFETALAIGALLILVSGAAMLAVKLFPSWKDARPGPLPPLRDQGAADPS